MDDCYEIPDDVWEERCQWCIHRTGNENRKIPKAWAFRYQHDKDKPCRIMGIAKMDEIPGECRSFAPNKIYGICMTCEHDNCFHEGFCLHDGQPNKRQVYIGQGYQNEAYYGVHRLSTCDAYTPSPFWFDTMRRQAAEGKIPRNFNPETMEPIGKGFGFEKTMHAIDAWERVENELKRENERREAARMRKLAEETAKASGQIAGQISMFQEE